MIVSINCSLLAKVVWPTQSTYNPLCYNSLAKSQKNCYRQQWTLVHYGLQIPNECYHLKNLTSICKGFCPCVHCTEHHNQWLQHVFDYHIHSSKSWSRSLGVSKHHKSSPLLMAPCHLGFSNHLIKCCTFNLDTLKFHGYITICQHNTLILCQIQECANFGNLLVFK